MATKIDSIAAGVAAYRAKEACLKERADWTEPMDFYRELFPVGSFELDKHNN
jgi:hypothetical protein